MSESNNEAVCKCDCVNCAAGDHDGCYYDARYPDTIEQCPFRKSGAPEVIQ